MRNHRFTPITWILVALLLGVLYKVGTIVTPPPPAPPPPPKAPASKAEIQAQKEMRDKMRKEMEAHEKLMAEEMKHPKKGGDSLKTPPGYHMPDISPTYFTKHKMGEAGINQASDAAPVKKSTQ